MPSAIVFLRPLGLRLLGTNGTVRMSDCTEVLRIAGPKRRVFFVNNHMPRSWQDPNNASKSDRSHVVL